MTVYKFNEQAISNAIEAAKKTHEGNQLNAKESHFDIIKVGNLLVAAECITITTENHQVCVNLPLGIGKKCFSIPISIPDGTAGKACLNICTKFGVPTGVKVTVEIGGVIVVSQSFGKC